MYFLAQSNYLISPRNSFYFYFFFLFLFLFSLVIQETFLNQIVIFNLFKINLLLIFIFLIIFFFPWRLVLTLTLLSGIILDLFSFLPFGIFTFNFVFNAFLIKKFLNLFQVSNPLIFLLSFIIFLFLYKILFILELTIWNFFI